MIRPVLAVAAALVVTACSSGSGRQQPHGSPTAAATNGPRGTQQVTINATSSFRFEPATVTAHTGLLKVNLVDIGAYPHNLSLAQPSFTSDTVTGGVGKDKTTFTLTFNHPGTYKFVCTYHSSAGMRGQFIIR